MNRVRILLLDEQPFFRDGVRTFLQASPRFMVAGEADETSTALQLAKTVMADVAILDLKLPQQDGLETLRSFRAENLALHVLFLSMQREQVLVDEAINLGARGYVLKDDPREYLGEAIQAAVRGEIWISPKLTRALLTRRSANQKLSLAQPSVALLTATERRVAALVAENLTSREIAKRLGSSILTVETHRRNAARKLQIGGAHGFLRFVLRHRSQLNDDE